MLFCCGLRFFGGFKNTHMMVLARWSVRERVVFDSMRNHVVIPKRKRGLNLIP